MNRWECEFWCDAPIWHWISIKVYVQTGIWFSCATHKRIHNTVCRFPYDIYVVSLILLLLLLLFLLLLNASLSLLECIEISNLFALSAHRQSSRSSASNKQSPTFSFIRFNAECWFSSSSHSTATHLHLSRQTKQKPFRRNPHISKVNINNRHRQHTHTLRAKWDSNGNV